MPKLTEEGLKKIEEKITSIFTTEMEVRDFQGDTVPSVDDLPDKNKGLLVTNCTILFVDIRSSTKLSDKSQAKSMAKIYRAFARAMSICIYECDGKVRQIAGDRVMGVFVDDAEESSVQKAMEAARAIISIIKYTFNPLCRTNVNNKEIACGVGIDTGRVLVTPIGIKHKGDDSRDLVWAGKIANIASKLTDLAEASEIFVTNRFYEKLPANYKVYSDGSTIWTKSLRAKGANFFEGYGVQDYYISELIHDGTDTDNKEEKKQINSDVDTMKLEGLNIGHVVTEIVQDVEFKVDKLLKNFEQIILREAAVATKESHIQEIQNAMQIREADLRKREAHLNEREQELNSILAYKEKEIKYTLRIDALKDRITTIGLEDFLIELKTLQDLGVSIGKKIGTVHNDMRLWSLVMYLHEKGESELAFKILVGQLTDDLPTAYIPLDSHSIPIIKKVGKEQEYLEAVIYFIQNNSPSVKQILQLRKNLNELGLNNELLDTLRLYLEE